MARRWGGAVALATALGLAADPRAAGAASAAVELLQPDGSPLADAVLAAYALDSPPPAPAPRAAVMDQRDRKFVPQILVVERGAKVSFTNSDSVNHHVYSFSPARRFQLYLDKAEKHVPAPVVEFDRAGVVVLGCNLHDWMLGYVDVVDTPHFAKTDAAGRALLPGLAAGRYRLELWHPRITDPDSTLRREATLEAGAAEIWRLRLVRPLLPSRDQVPAFHDYGGLP